MPTKTKTPGLSNSLKPQFALASGARYFRRGALLGGVANFLLDWGHNEPLTILSVGLGTGIGAFTGGALSGIFGQHAQKQAKVAAVLLPILGGVVGYGLAPRFDPPSPGSPQMVTESTYKAPTSNNVVRATELPEDGSPMPAPIPAEKCTIKFVCGGGI